MGSLKYIKNYDVDTTIFIVTTTWGKLKNEFTISTNTVKRLEDDDVMYLFFDCDGDTSVYSSYSGQERLHERYDEDELFIDYIPCDVIDEVYITTNDIEVTDIYWEDIDELIMEGYVILSSLDAHINREKLIYSRDYMYQSPMFKTSEELLKHYVVPFAVMGGEMYLTFDLSGHVILVSPLNHNNYYYVLSNNITDDHVNQYGLMKAISSTIVEDDEPIYVGALNDPVLDLLEGVKTKLQPTFKFEQKTAYEMTLTEALLKGAHGDLSGTKVGDKLYAMLNDNGNLAIVNHNDYVILGKHVLGDLEFLDVTAIATSERPMSVGYLRWMYINNGINRV